MLENAGKLEGKVAFITGASRGIGRSIALGFSREGAKVVLSSRKAEALEGVAAEVRDAGGEALVVPVHTGKPEQITEAVAKAVEAFGTIDVLVNNAATNPIFGPVLNATVEAWDKIMDVNLKGYYLMSLEGGKVMMERGGGTVVNIASTAGMNVMPGLGIYSVSKAGVLMLTKVLAWEWAAFKIRVNAVAPGLVETKFSQALWSVPEILEEVEKRTPMARIGKPEEIVGAALYLASDQSSYTTGETIVVDGGARI